jgi:site-specific recombinase XerD
MAARQRPWSCTRRGRALVHAVGTGAVDTVAVSRFLAELRERSLSASTLHQAYRTLKTFCLRLRYRGALTVNPFDGFALRTPRTFPQLRTEDELRAVLAACGERTVTERRNRALLLVMLDAGLRASETMRLLVDDWTPAERSLLVRCRKGQRDRTVFLSPTTARAIRDSLGVRHLVAREDFRFVTEDGRPLTPRFLVHLCHRLSRKAGLPSNRRLHPHALRHLAATSWLRNGVGLDEVRRLLGRSTLDTTLRYSNLVSADLRRAHRMAAGVERMRLE